MSAYAEKRPEVQKMVEYMADKLREVGVTYKLHDVGKETLPNGKIIDLPNVILGHLGTSKEKKTVLVYGHLDVQPAAKEDGWNTDPFILTEINGNVIGIGDLHRVKFST